MIMYTFVYNTGISRRTSRVMSSHVKKNISSHVNNSVVKRTLPEEEENEMSKIMPFEMTPMAQQ